MHRQLMWSRVIQLRGPLKSSCKKLQVKVGGRGPKEHRAQRGRAGRRMDRINHKAGKCLCLPGFIPCVDGGSPRLEQVCTLLLLMLSQMLFSSGGQDSHPLRVWPTPAAWSIFSEWIKINTMMFTIKCVKTRLPGLGVKE